MGHVARGWVAHLQMEYKEEQSHNDRHDDLLEGSSAHE